MKKFLILGLLMGCLLPSFVYARPLDLDESKCPRNIVCSNNEILGDDGKCYACDSEKEIEIRCIGWEKARETCPNRLIGNPAFVSYLICPAGLVEFEGRSCFHKCKDGYEGIEEYGCKNKETGDWYFTDF